MNTRERHLMRKRSLPKFREQANSIYEAEIIYSEGEMPSEAEELQGSRKEI